MTKTPEEPPEKARETAGESGNPGERGVPEVPEVPGGPGGVLAEFGVRRAGAGDVAVVRAVTDAAFEPYVERIGVVPAPMEADHAANIAAGRVFVTGEPVTGLVVVEARADHLYLDVVAVRPDAHGRGVGGRLLRFVDAHARALGLDEVRLYTNAMMWENQKIYPKLGYEVTERRVDGPYDRVHYRKRLG